MLSELCYALGVDAEHAGAYIDEHIDGGAIAEASIHVENGSLVTDATSPKRR